MTTAEMARPSAAPERSLTQRLDALANANRIRTKRAVLKRDLKAGRKQVVPLLLDPPEWLLTAKVMDLLLAVPKFGQVKVTRVLNACRISPSKTIGGLSERQRGELAGFMRSGHAPNYAVSWMATSRFVGSDEGSVK